MIRKLSVRQAGGSVSITVPKDISERHHFTVGEDVFVIETEDGVLFTAHDPDFERALEINSEGARKFRNALRELAR